MSSFSTNSAEFSESDAGNVILLQIKVFSRNIKEAKLARYFTKVTARPSFARLRVIRRKKMQFIKYQNGKYVTKVQLYLLLFIFP